MGSDADRLVRCPDCNGTGEDGALHPCSTCRGDGVIPRRDPKPAEPPKPARAPSPVRR